MSKENSLFNEKTIKKLISDVKIIPKQKRAVKEWLELLKSGKLED